MGWSIRRGPHGVDLSVVIVNWTFRSTVVAAIVATALWTASVGKVRNLGVPFVKLGPPPTVELLYDGWCPDGKIYSWPPTAYCKTPTGVRGQRSWENWLMRRGGAHFDLTAHTKPHPWIMAVLFFGLAWLAFRVTRPIDLQVRGNGVRLGGRFVHRDQLRECEIERRLGFPAIAVYTEEGRWVSPPLRIAGWRCALLVADIRNLIPSTAEIEERRIAGSRLDREATALLGAARRPTTGTKRERFEIDSQGR